jgi:hypothetical protein
MEQRRDLRLPPTWVDVMERPLSHRTRSAPALRGSRAGGFWSTPTTSGRPGTPSCRSRDEWLLCGHTDALLFGKCADPPQRYRRSRRWSSRASFLAGPAGLDSSAADPGMALVQVQDEAWELEVAPAQERAPGARASGSCQSSYAESAPLSWQHHAAQSKNDEFPSGSTRGAEMSNCDRDAAELLGSGRSFHDNAQYDPSDRSPADGFIDAE